MSSKLTRRSFLTAATAAVTGPTILSGCVRGRETAAPAKPKPSDKIVVGCLGMGWQGPGNMGQLLGQRDVQVVAVCDLDRGPLRRGKQMVDMHYGNKDCAAYGKFEEILARDDLDAVMIAFPDHWHAIPVIMAANKGLHIYGEKPLSHTLREGRAMVKAVEKNGVVWQTGSWQRSTRNFHEACELVRAGRIGKVKYVEVGLSGGYDDYTESRDEMTPTDPPPGLDYERWIGPAPMAPYCRARVHKNWRWNLDYGGGKLMDWIGHHLDIAHWGLGLDDTGPIMIEGTGEAKVEGVWNAHTSFDCTCTYADDLVIKVGSHHKFGTKWYGEDGWIFVTRGDTQASDPKILEDKVPAEKQQLIKSRNHMRNFIDCIRNGGETITPIETAHRSASVGHLCFAAIQTGRKLHWDPKKETFKNDKEASKILEPDYRKPWTLKV